MQIRGVVKDITPLEHVGRNNIPKRVIVVEEQKGEYPNGSAIDFIKDKVEQLARINIGDVVTVDYNNKVREYNGKRYNSLNGRQINVDTSLRGEEDSTDDDLPF